MLSSALLAGAHRVRFHLSEQSNYIQYAQSWSMYIGGHIKMLPSPGHRPRPSHHAIHSLTPSPSSRLVNAVVVRRRSQSQSFHLAKNFAMSPVGFDCGLAYTAISKPDLVIDHLTLARTVFSILCTLNV